MQRCAVLLAIAASCVETVYALIFRGCCFVILCGQFRAAQVVIKVHLTCQLNEYL